MDRVAIKNQAKEMIRGNKWFVWKPIIMLALVSFAVGLVSGIIDGILGGTGVVSGIITLVWGLFSVALGVGYVCYLLSFVRGQKQEWKSIFTYAKEHWKTSLVAGIIVSLISMVGSILLVIPGIIAQIGLTFWAHVSVDNPDLGAMDVVKKAWNLTKGYKFSIFVFMLSFIGWAILAELTLGLLLIWLFPYIAVATALVYESIKTAK